MRDESTVSAPVSSLLNACVYASDLSTSVKCWRKERSFRYAQANRVHNMAHDDWGGLQDGPNKGEIQ